MCDITYIRLKEVDSTSRYLKNYVINNEMLHPVVCVAENQTKGYGQYGHSWSSSIDSLVFSVAFKSPKKLIDPIFSLLVALVLRDSLAKFSNNRLYVKWPNDIYSKRGKISGCLIEAVTNKVNAVVFLVIGIGINNNGDSSFEFSGADFLNNIDKEELLKCIVIKLNELFSLCTNLSFNKFFLNWKNNDLFQINQPVQLEYKGVAKNGVYKGLSENGELKILINNEVKVFITGQVSIKPLKSVV